MLKGAIGGALFGALTGGGGGGGGGKRSGGGRGSCSGGLCEAGNCFAAGTAVQTEGGEVAIDALRVGDAVWAEDDATGAVSLKHVTAVHARDADEVLAVDVGIEDGGGENGGMSQVERLEVTPEHPFFTAAHGWVHAGALVAGDRLVLLSRRGDGARAGAGNAGGAAWVAAVHESAKQRVYNVEVEDAHTYFAGHAGVWVHNGCGGGRPSNFRGETVQSSWNNAAEGPTGGKLCPTCSKEVHVAPGTGRRDWDIDHQPPWSTRDSSGLSRKQVLDDYNTGTRLECPSCNRSRGARPAK
jgi:Pretoxin HINT domain/HNH/ENDO VII superfamily nuclease with conserved GHE residues